jgi:hypothetical protein
MDEEKDNRAKSLPRSWQILRKIYSRKRVRNRSLRAKWRSTHKEDVGLM